MPSYTARRCTIPYILLLSIATCLLLHSSCKNREEQTPSSRLIPIKEAKGYIVPQDSIETPISIVIDERKLKKVKVTNPRKVPAKNNSVPAIQAQTLPMGILKICIPGKDSFELPAQEIITVTPVQAPPPEIVLVKDMKVKDKNPYNFGSYNKLQGLKSSHILNMMEDRHGHLWLCTPGAFTKYDGKYFSHYIIQKDIEDWTCHIQEDTVGNIWFCTRDGFVKYDGITFAYFNQINGPHPVTPYLVEKSGTIWSGSKSGGVNKITHTPAEPGKSLDFTVSHFGKNQGFTDKIVDKIIQDKSGHVWFLTRTCEELIKLEMNVNDPDLLHTFSHFNTTYLKFDIFSPDLVQDHNGALWFTGEGRILQYDGDSLRMFTDKESGNERMFPRMVDHEGNIWGNIYLKGIFKYTFPKPGSTLRQAPHRNNGTFTHFTMEDGLSSNHTDAILEDRNGNIWIGTRDGVNLFNGKVLTHLSKNEGLQNSMVMSIHEDKSGNLWFGSSGYGISRYDGNSFCYYDIEDGLCNSFIRTVMSDTKGNIWFGSVWGGVSRFTPSGVNGEGTFTNFTKADGLDGSVYDICEDHSGNIWFAEASTYAKVYCYTPPKRNHFGLLTHYTPAHGLCDTNTDCIVEDIDRNLWFATDKGITRYTPPNSDHPAIFCHFTKESGLSYDDVRSIVIDHKGNFWFGTFGNGLIFFDGEAFIEISEKEGLIDNHIKSGLSDRAGNLWFGTNSGLLMLTKNNVDTIAEKVATGTLRESDLHFRTFKYEDGFLGITCNTHSIFEDKNGTIWVGANDKLTAYHPEGDVHDTVSPNIQLTGIELFNESVDWMSMQRQPDTNFVLGNGVKIANAKFKSLSSWNHVPENLNLAHDNNYITFKFIGITTTRPRSVKYQYKLDGQDDTWSTPSSNNFATYGNLPPGDYILKVKAMNSERYWSPELTYPFTIRRPWWESWWAYTFYILLVSATVYAIYNFFKRRLQLQHQLKAEQNEAIRLKELDTFKSQLFTNLTHEFRTPLTVILGMAKQLTGGAWSSMVAANEKARISQGLKMIENNGKNLLQLINQLLDLSKLENKSFRLQNIQGDIIPYVRYVTESFQSYAEDIGLSIRFFSEIDSLMMDFDPEQMKQIQTNLISNALKFTPSGGEIIVSAGISQDQLSLTVTDTGIGISEKDLPYVLDRFYQADSSTTRVAQGTGIGLAHTQELLKIMGGSISLKSDLGKGTSITILLPIRNEAALEEKDIILQTKPHVSISQQQAETITDNASSQDQHATSNETVPQLLIIEDNRDVVEYLKSCLEDQYRINVAYNGKAGVDIALEAIPDFIISDVMMPEMDGYQVCDLLKNDERTSHIPIILLTAKADAASRLAGLRRGADAYMAKPFNPEELHIHISMLLENRRRMAAHFSKLLHDGTSLPMEDTPVPEPIQFEDAFMKKVNAVIGEHYTDEYFSLPELCHHLGMSRSQLFRKMKAVADVAPSDLIRSYRLKKAKAMLENEDLSVAEVTYKVGFKDPSYFSKLFQEEFGVQPSSIVK